MSTKISSISPIDDSLVWSGEATDSQQIDLVIQRAADVSADWRRVPVDDRIAIVRRYGEFLSEHRDEIGSLITREVGKLGWDARGEVAASIAKVELSIEALSQRRNTQTIAAGGVSRVTRFQPLGVALVLGPFNFPLHLPGGQIIPALLSGNTVVFKPSEQATAVGQWIVKAWQHAGLPDGVLQLLVGGVDTAVAAIDHPQVAAVFLTGSRAAGKAIHQQLAGRPDVLLALELGGNNPIVVTDVAAEVAASIVSFSAFISSGQRCTCARRAIFTDNAQSTACIEALVDRTKRIRVGYPGDDPVPEVGPLISAAAADGVRQTYQQLIELGCQPLVEWQTQLSRNNLVRPAMVDASSLSESSLHQLGDMEWFGPLLVVQRAANLDAAIDLAGRTSYGLAASLLGGTREMFESFVASVGAGVVNWNRPTTGAAGALPFGGLGDSGNHRPAGFYAIDFCNDPVASLESERVSTDDPWQAAS